MFARSYFAAHYFADRYFPQSSAGGSIQASDGGGLSALTGICGHSAIT